MANRAGSSSSRLETLHEEDDYDSYGAESGWVEAKTHCDHLPSLSSDLTHIPIPSTPCSRCQHPSENWLCLSCKVVLCSRFVNKHMLEHYQQTTHSIALSFRYVVIIAFYFNFPFCYIFVARERENIYGSFSR
uniref:UBP-type domain-containing protein n=1 Tax=Gossypium raimondii TaxID=29730 RepID=A0A0D2RS07_GOSRA|nr:hypothetical protein B456_005G232800 [Gossypium raimondii]